MMLAERQGDSAMAADKTIRNTPKPHDEYVATPEELAAIDAAIASIEAGEVASEAEIEAAFARFRRMG